MLINFTVENWMSFRERAHLSLVASRERQHSDRLSHIKKYNLRLLPTCAIYGGNASGKTNLCQAISFLRHLVVHSSQSDEQISVEPYRLGNGDSKEPIRFCIELLADNTIYELSLVMTRDAILNERLVRIVSSNEHVLYTRTGEEYKFHRSWEKDQFLQFAKKGTGQRQLFLTNCVNQKDERFKPVYDWFNDNLVLIGPDARFGPLVQLIQPEHPHQKIFNTSLSRLDTGIVHLGVGEISFGSFELPEEMKEEIENDVKEGKTVYLMPSPDERLQVTRKGGKLIVKTVVAYHESNSGEEIQFDMSQESDGTKRVIDLLPAFIIASEETSSKVYVVDELDRSLHTLLSRQLLDGYLVSCSPEKRSQIIFTTHDVMLMDQRLLRRDEMYVTERDEQGSSRLFSFSEYKDVRKDKDIRKSYLEGRLGGVPRILLSGPIIQCADDNTDKQRSKE